MILDEYMLVNEDESEFINYADDVEDETLTIPPYSITSYGIDYDVAGLVRRLKDNEILIPRFQRGLVWSQAIASRFVESLLLGLPVPGIFLYRLDDDRYEVIDGQQRIRTLRAFEKGVFKETSFKLIGLDPKSEFAGLTYEDLAGNDRRRLNNSIIHATVIRQTQPDDSGSSKFSIFERLNTNAKPLSAQEIRIAIYQGEFNDLISDLNGHAAWRSLYGKTEPRKRDEELILRFLALHYGFEDYASPMKRYLNEFMFENRNLNMYSAEQIKPLFADTVQTILDKIGERAFIRTRRVHAALCDSLMVGVARRLRKGTIVSDIKPLYDELRRNEEFDDLISDTTSAAGRLRRRMQHAIDAFATVE